MVASKYAAFGQTILQVAGKNKFFHWTAHDNFWHPPCENVHFAQHLPWIFSSICRIIRLLKK